MAAAVVVIIGHSRWRHLVIKVGLSRVVGVGLGLLGVVDVLVAVVEHLLDVVVVEVGLGPLDGVVDVLVVVVLQRGDINAPAPSYKNSVFSEFSATVGQQQPQQQQQQQPPQLPPQPPQPQPSPRRQQKQPQPDSDSDESDEEGQDTVIDRRQLQSDDISDSSDSSDANLDVSWSTASAGPSEANTLLRQARDDLDETVTSFLPEKFNFRPSPSSSPT